MLDSILREVVETLLALYHADGPEEPSIPIQGNHIELFSSDGLFKRMNEYLVQKS